MRKRSEWHVRFVVLSCEIDGDSGHVLSVLGFVVPLLAPALARATSTGTMASSMVEDDEEYSIVVTGGGPSKAAKGVSKKSSKATPKPEQSDSEDEGRGRKGGKGKSKKGKRREESSDDEPVKQTAPAKPGKGQTAASKGSAKAAKESDVSVSDDTITTHVLAWDSVGLRDHPELLTAIVRCCKL
jgi:hypothetical protein